MAGLFLNIGLISCEKDPVQIDFVLEGFETETYYESEIFDETYCSLYGKWRLYEVSGGIHGGGHTPNFDYLEIKKFGIYGFIRNDSILEYGRIIVDEQTKETLLIHFEPDANSDVFMYDSEKYVEFYEKGRLSLDSPCCDRYNYHFIRAK